jgi:hypothetical protein
MEIAHRMVNSYRKWQKAGNRVSFFFHSGTFRLSTWHFCSACAECQAGSLMIETQNRTEVDPLFVYVSAGPCVHLLEEPVAFGTLPTERISCAVGCM